MFPQFKKRNNESGIVLFIVLMVAIIIMIFSVGILSQSSNEINYAQQQIDQISSDELAQGIWWNAYSSQVGTSSVLSPLTTYQSENGRNYQISLSAGPTVNGIPSYSVAVNYDTF